MPSAERAPARLRANEPPQLLTVVHTEEEFDWGRPFDRAERGVTHLAGLPRAQKLFERHGVIPNYVVDYPIVEDGGSAALFRELSAAGRATVGAHLHPWVSPPYDEDVNLANSYPGNLPRELEGEKLRRLTEAIAERMAVRPTVYLAGRYGYGPNTRAILASLGYEIDLSASPTYDYSADGGPDFRSETCEMFWEADGGGAQRLLRIPHTAGYAGWFCRSGVAIADLRQSTIGRALHAPGILARLGAIRHVRLSPEGFEIGDLKLLATQLRSAGLSVFLFSFHSPSLMPGFTPYVRSQGDLEAFLTRIEQFYDFFTGEFGGEMTTAAKVKQLADAIARANESASV